MPRLHVADNSIPELFHASAIFMNLVYSHTFRFCLTDDDIKVFLLLVKFSKTLSKMSLIIFRLYIFNVVCLNLRVPSDSHRVCSNNEIFWLTLSLFYVVINGVHATTTHHKKIHSSGKLCIFVSMYYIADTCMCMFVLLILNSLF